MLEHLEGINKVLYGVLILILIIDNEKVMKLSRKTSEKVDEIHEMLKGVENEEQIQESSDRSNQLS